MTFTVLTKYSSSNGFIWQAFQSSDYKIFCQQFGGLIMEALIFLTDQRQSCDSECNLSSDSCWRNGTFFKDLKGIHYVQPELLTYCKCCLWNSSIIACLRIWSAKASQFFIMSDIFILDKNCGLAVIYKTTMVQTFLLDQKCALHKQLFNYITIIERNHWGSTHSAWIFQKGEVYSILLASCLKPLSLLWFWNLPPDANFCDGVLSYPISQILMQAWLWRFFFVL